MQFQEKLQELSPLPDLLKGAQIQLQEAKELQKLAEDSSQQLSYELHRVKEKVGATYLLTHFFLWVQRVALLGLHFIQRVIE